MSKFVKVVECLYRYSLNVVYYARHKRNGKQIWESLKTNDKEHAKNLLRDKKSELAAVDLSAGKITLEDLCKRYLATIQHQKPKTIEAKTGVVERIRTKNEWSGGIRQQVKEIRPSEIQTFLSIQGKRVGKSAYNQYVQMVKDIFMVAVMFCPDRLRGRRCSGRACGCGVNHCSRSYRNHRGYRQCERLSIPEKVETSASPYLY